MLTLNKGKIALLSGVAFIVLWFTIPFTAHLAHTIFHQVTKPSATICVKSHYNTVMIPMYISNGKTTTMTMVPSQQYICDEEAPNPNYAQELEKWRASK